MSVRAELAERFFASFGPAGAGLGPIVPQIAATKASLIRPIGAGESIRPADARSAWIVGLNCRRQGRAAADHVAAVRNVAGAN